VDFICLGYDEGSTFPWHVRIHLTINAVSYPRGTESWCFYSYCVLFVTFSLCLLCIGDKWLFGGGGGAKISLGFQIEISNLFLVQWQLWNLEMTIVMLQDHVTVWSVLEVPPCAKPESFIVWPTNHIVTFTSACSIGSVLYFVRLWLLLLLVWLTSWMGSKITARCRIIRLLVQRDLCQIGELVLFSLYCSIFWPESFQMTIH
jgi:hypothetical protein